jgi:hypothetical protein
VHHRRWNASRLVPAAILRDPVDAAPLASWRSWIQTLATT